MVGTRYVESRSPSAVGRRKVVNARQALTKGNLTVEADEQMDLSDFDIRVHGGVWLDVVGDAMFLHRHREALQGRAKECKEG